MNRIYSMCINIYKILPDLEKAAAEVFGGSYEAEVRQPNLLLVLVFDHIVQGNKLKIGGKLSRMVKDNVEPLRALLGQHKQEEGSQRELPKYAYLRLNQLKKSDGEQPSTIEELRE